MTVLWRFEQTPSLSVIWYLNVSISDFISFFVVWKKLNKIREVFLIRNPAAFFTFLDHTKGKIYPDEIFQVRIPIFEQQVCIESYERINVPITEMQVCAGIGDGDACQVSLSVW